MVTFQRKFNLQSTLLKLNKEIIDKLIIAYKISAEALKPYHGPWLHFKGSSIYNQH